MARCDIPRLQCLNWHARDHFRDPRPSGDLQNGVPTSYRVLCPAHPDTDHSLSISIGEKARLVWCCHRGCDPLAVRAGLIRDGVPADCLPSPKQATEELLDAITKLYAANPGHAELRWRVWSLVQGLGGELPARGRYPGGRRGFAADAGVGHTEIYGPHP